jgi:hypothetical protein
MEDGRGVTDESYDASLLTSGPQGNVGCQVIDGAWKVYLEGDIGGWRTLDIGTGFGPIPMELATLAPVEAVGVDVDRYGCAAGRPHASEGRGPLLVERFLSARSAVMEGGFLSARDFDYALAEYRAEHIAPECVVVTHLAVIGRRR